LCVILTRLNRPEGLLSNHFVFLERYDAEVVGDGVTEFAPFVGQGFLEETENSLGELIERYIVMIVWDPIVHDTPQAGAVRPMRTSLCSSVTSIC